MTLKSQIDLGHPVLVDTTLGTGHTLVLTGYDESHERVFFIDPGRAAPGTHDMSIDEFRRVWKSTKVGYHGRAAVLTGAPAD